MANGKILGQMPEIYTLTYSQDNYTLVIVEAHDVNETIYSDLLDSMNLIKSSSQNQWHKEPYIGPKDQAGPNYLDTAK